MNRMRWIGVGVGVGVTALMMVAGGLRVVAGAEDEPVPPIGFPADYRGWAHVKSVLIGPTAKAFPTEGGIHHIYANAAAMEGYRTGRFSDGAIVVYELLHVQERDGMTFEGARRRFDMMVKHSARFRETGGWGFERFTNESQTPSLNAEARGKCAACHQKTGTRELVIGAFRDNTWQ
jgi:hypothetical protein